MKYSQYHEIRELMESDIVASYGYDISEWESLTPEEKVDQLNEVVGFGPLALFGVPLASLGIGAGATILTLGVLFRKRLLRGIRMKRATRRLKRKAEKFKEKALEGLMDAIKPELDAKEEIKQQMGVSMIRDLPKEQKTQVEKIEKKISEVFARYVEKTTNLKSREVDKYIDGLKIKDKSKLALNFIWETLSAEVGVALLGELMKAKAIEIPSNVNQLNNSLITQANNLQKRGNQVVSSSGTTSPSPAGGTTQTPSGPTPSGPTGPLKGGLIPTP